MAKTQPGAVDGTGDGMDTSAASLAASPVTTAKGAASPSKAPKKRASKATSASAKGASPARARSAKPAPAKPAPAKPAMLQAASLQPGPDKPLPKEFVNLVRRLEAELGMPVCFMIHRGAEFDDRNMLGDTAKTGFYGMRAALPKGKPVALLLDSPGGYAESAYQIGRLLKKACGGYVTVIPRYAKSAATLLALGADRIIMGEHAEVGPLDAQWFDFEREDVMSSLDEVQALERLRAFALSSVDEATIFLRAKSRKKLETVLPLALNYVAALVRPLFERVDVVQYTKQSRVLKIAEEYAIRLLLHNGRPPDDAKKLVRSLVERYPSHGFFVDFDEAKALKLPVERPAPGIVGVVDDLYDFLSGMRGTYLGMLCDVTPAPAPTK